MSEASAIVLGGKNGYGKTTLFDAIELVLTGKIERYDSYEKKLFDHRRNLNDVEMPLVCDVNVPDIFVELELSYPYGEGEHRVTLLRKAAIGDMKNPVDFSVFAQLYICTDREEIHPITPEENDALGLAKYAKTYGTLGYLSQEESTLFVKSSDDERVSQIQYLFNTKRFDDRIEKIEKLIQKGIKKYLDELKGEKQNIESRIDDLKRYQIGGIGGDATYQPLFIEKAHIKWDLPNVVLNNEEYHSLLTEQGLIEQLQEMVGHKDDIRKYRKDKFLQSILDRSGDFAFYWQYREKKGLIKLWREFYDKTFVPFRELELSRVEQYSLIIPRGLAEVVNSEFTTVSDEAITRIKALYRSATLAERAYNEMLDQRNRLESHLQNHAEQLSQTHCPLCGHGFQDHKELLESIAQTTALQRNSARVLSDQAAQELLRTKRLVNERVITTVMSWFEGQGVTKEVVEKYLSLDENYIEVRLSELIKREYISEQPKGSVDLSEASLLKTIEEQWEPFPDGLDYEKLLELHNNYGKMMTAESYQLDAVMQKRAFLLQRWSMQQSELMKRLQQDLQLVDAKIAAANEKKRSLKALSDDLERQKNEWLKQVITDVEILFFIYSGRIMQDNFFGRGLFMKTEPDKYIYFVSDPNSDVDALYKMSSGQLVALMMSLLLSLNKLYATEKFIAIDDPVQTIDDINVWGFVETLRNEFRDYQLLFSTHEVSYGSFLRYKLSKMGIKTEYRDMLKERKSDNY
jgi:hypothetical protein